jgi:hypothetical protein
MPIATLRQEPPTTGMNAPRPSAALTGRKSMSASPQLSSMVLFARSGRQTRTVRLHGASAFFFELTHQGVDLPLGGMKTGHRR